MYHSRRLFYREYGFLPVSYQGHQLKHFLRMVAQYIIVNMMGYIGQGSRMKVFLYFL